MSILNNITADNAADFNFVLSDGTPVDFVKITSKDRIQVRLPETHDYADDDLRIFRRDGNHYQDLMGGITLSATAKTVAAPTAGIPLASFVQFLSAQAPDLGDDGKLIIRGTKVYELVHVGDLVDA